MSLVQWIVLIYFGLINLITFVYRGVDKWSALKGWWRVSEKRLLVLVALGGGAGALFGMQIWRHKTLKGSFLWKVYGLLVVWVVVLVGVMGR